MSDQTRSLPITRESGEEKSENYDGSGKDVLAAEKIQTISEDELTSDATTKPQSFDDSVFLTISTGTDARENDQPESSESTLTTLNTVQVNIHEDDVTLNSTEGEYQEARIPFADNLRGNILLAHPSSISSTDVGDVQPKHRKLSNPPETPEISFTDSRETEMYSKFAAVNEIPITCKRNHAFLYKNKLGSGKKGKCIKFANEWYSPSEFETVSGLEMSKDWKRSLRYGGRSILNFVNKGYLRPHAAACTCSTCSEDSSITGPILYYTPKIRKKRIATASLSADTLSLEHDRLRPNTAPPTKQFSHSFENGKDLPSKLPADILNVLKTTNLPFTMDTKRLFQALAENEQKDRKIWSKLEKKTESLMEKFDQLQQTILTAKKESEERRNQILKEIYIVFRNQNVSHYIPNQSTSHFINRMNASEKLCEVIPDDDDDDEVSEICAACGNPANSECTGCRKATYCSTECQEMDWNRGHRDVCRSLASQDSNSSTSNELPI